MQASASAASAPLELPCGLVLKNRLIKSAMSEKMAVNQQPTAAHQRLYTRWAQGGWAALVTGNIMVDDLHLGSAEDVAVSGPESAVIERWTAWISDVHGYGCHVIAQLNHPGRQSPLGAGKRGLLSKTLAPSAVPLNLGNNWIAWAARTVLFGTPLEMNRDQIDNVIVQFARAAKLASRSGFRGVEIQAGHGFLLSQFMASSSNRRQDEFGGSAEKRAELVLRIIRAIRTEVPASFCVGIKINTADHMDHEGFADMLRQISLIQKESVDYVQLSGGSFDKPEMLLNTSRSVRKTGDISSRTIAREGFFLEASQKIRRQFPQLVLIVTGGFRSRKGIDAALEGGACDAVGLGRPAVKFPDLPKTAMLDDDDIKGQARFDVERAPSPGWIATKIRVMGSGAETKYYSSLIQQL